MTLKVDLLLLILCKALMIRCCIEFPSTCYALQKHLEQIILDFIELKFRCLKGRTFPHKSVKRPAFDIIINNCFSLASKLIILDKNNFKLIIDERYIQC